MSSITKYEQKQQNLSYLKSMAKIAAESKQYANMTETSLLNLMLSAHDLGISPLKAVNGGFYIVNGKVCMATSLMADRIRKAGHSIKIIEMSKEKCVIIGKRKDNEDSLKLEYTWEDATLAGLTNSATWKKYPKIMLYNRCMSSVARILFSDVIGNAYSEEERFDIQNVPADQRPLENPEEEVTIESPILSEKLSEEQCAQLDVYLEEDQEAAQRITDKLEIQTVYDMNPKDLEKVLTFLKTRKENRANESTRVA